LATNAKLQNPITVAFGPDGSLYIAEATDVVRRVKPDGKIETVAGVRCSAGYNGDGRDAKTATLNEPTGLVVGVDGSLYIADKNNNLVRRVDPSGTITTVAGDGGSGATPGGRNGK